MSLRILRASAIVTLLSLASMGANFLLQVFLAHQFGAGTTTDAYLAAATIPTLANTVFLTAMNITFIPVFIEYESKSTPEEAWTIVNSFMVLVLLSLTLFTVIGNIYSERLILLIAPGLGRNAAALSLAAHLQRWQLPALVFMAWGGLQASLFYARQSFIIATLGPLLANLITLILAWLLRPIVGIEGVAIGLLAGNIGQVIFFRLSLRQLGTGRGRLNLAHPGVRQIGRLMVPWLLGAMIYKANPLVDRFIASQFSAGAISILGYAASLVQVAVFASSKGASLAVFPVMSQLAHSQQQDQLPGVIDTGLRLVISAVLPVIVLLLLLGEPLVALVLQRGAFSAEDAALTAMALIAYMGAILALASGNIVTYVYYALQDTVTPVIVGTVGMGVNLALALLWRDDLGFLAPALSYSVMTLFNLGVLVFTLRRRLGAVVRPGFLRFCAQMGLLGVGMTGVLWLTRQSVTLMPVLTAWPPWGQLLYHSLVALMGYVLGWVLLNRTLLRRVWRG